MGSFWSKLRSSSTTPMQITDRKRSQSSGMERNKLVYTKKQQLRRKISKKRPSISTPIPINPSFLNGGKWKYVIVTMLAVDEFVPKPPPRKKRKSRRTSFELSSINNLNERSTTIISQEFGVMASSLLLLSYNSNDEICCGSSCDLINVLILAKNYIINILPFSETNVFMTAVAKVKCDFDKLTFWKLYQSTIRLQMKRFIQIQFLHNYLRKHSTKRQKNRSRDITYYNDHNSLNLLENVKGTYSTFYVNTSNTSYLPIQSENIAKDMTTMKTDKKLLRNGNVEKLWQEMKKNVRLKFCKTVKWNKTKTPALKNNILLTQVNKWRKQKLTTKCKRISIRNELEFVGKGDCRSKIRPSLIFSIRSKVVDSLDDDSDCSISDSLNEFSSSL